MTECRMSLYTCFYFKGGGSGQAENPEASQAKPGLLELPLGRSGLTLIRRKVLQDTSLMMRPSLHRWEAAHPKHCAGSDV